MAKFDPEKMAVYRLARQHTRAVNALLASSNTRGFADQVMQLRRSASSIPANLLESAGEWRAGKRLNYLMIAKGSTWECWAHIDTLVDFGVVDPSAIAEVRDLQSQITALLITTIRNIERQGGTAACTSIRPPPRSLKSKSKSKIEIEPEPEPDPEPPPLQSLTLRGGP